MTVLYVKHNSERSREFQLKTIIYEHDGQKFVKKQAMCNEALLHLERMKQNYALLTESITDQRIKLAKIIDESHDSVTFEYIDGISFEKKLCDAKKASFDAFENLIQEYLLLITNGFKTKSVIVEKLQNSTFSQFFGESYTAVEDEVLCFEKTSNIDLIFSNIIYKDGSVYIIDYEWALSFSVPIRYVLFRAMVYFGDIDMTTHFTEEELSIYGNCERVFLQNTVISTDSFYQKKNQYLKKHSNVSQILEEKEKMLLHKENEIKELHTRIQSMRLINRLKRIVKYIIPEYLRKHLRK